MGRCFAVALVWVVACGGAPAAGTETTPETAETARESPSGPVPSVMYDAPDFSIRFDVATLRSTPLGPDLSSAYASGGLFSRALGAGGVDPVAALDVVALTARNVTFTSGGLFSESWRVAARHRLGVAGARSALERSAVGLGETVVWRESQGITSARFPISATVHALILSGPAEVVLGRDDEMGELVTVVRDHIARRAADETIEPSLLLPAGLVFDASVSSLPPMASSFGLNTLSLRGTREGGGLRISGEAGVAPGSDATVVATQLQAEVDRVEANALMASMGLSGILSRLTLTPDAGAVHFETTADWTELRALLQLIVAATS